MRNPNTTKAYEFLRERILSGEFEPGAFLSAQRLSGEIGVSRTPVREALRQLEYDELVKIVPKLGAVVKSMTADEFQELLGYREALEVFAVGRAAALRRPEEIAVLEAVLERMRKTTELLQKNHDNEQALMDLADQDIHFHRAIFEMARNSFIRDKSERAHILQRMVTPALASKWITQEEMVQTNNVNAVFIEHTDIFEAIQAGDEVGARAAMTRHLSNFTKKMFQRSHAGLGGVVSRSAAEAMI